MSRRFKLSEPFVPKPGNLYTVLVTRKENGETLKQRFFFTAANEREAVEQYEFLAREDDRYSAPEEVNFILQARPLPITDVMWVPVRGKAAKAGE